MDDLTYTRVRIGISMCLLGEQVRYDGGHKRDRFLVEVFGRHVDWVPVCPEVEIGLSIPRDNLRLVDSGDGVHLITQKTGQDHTSKMNSFSARRLTELGREGISGFVLKRASPSCGLERVKVYRNDKLLHRNGQGLFADGLVKKFPQLPVEEEGRLNDCRLRESFVTRVFAYHRWRQLASDGLSRRSLMRFHEQHKFVLMSRNQQGARRLGNLVGESRAPVQDLSNKYLEEFSDVMSRTPSRRGHTNVLQHMAGFVTDHLNTSDREELTTTIDSYRRELLPLIVPVTLIRHYVRKFEIVYLQNQTYLNPHPHELMLLNEV